MGGQEESAPHCFIATAIISSSLRWSAAGGRQAGGKQEWKVTNMQFSEPRNVYLQTAKHLLQVEISVRTHAARCCEGLKSPVCLPADIVLLP